MKKILLTFLAVLALANIFMFGLSPQKPASYVFTNVSIFDPFQTANENNAIAFTDGKKVFYGQSEHVYPLIGEDTKVNGNNNHYFVYPTTLKDYQLIKIDTKLNRADIVKMFAIEKPIEEMDYQYLVFDGDLEVEAANLKFFVDGEKVIEIKK